MPPSILFLSLTIPCDTLSPSQLSERPENQALGGEHEITMGKYGRHSVQAPLYPANGASGCPRGEGCSGTFLLQRREESITHTGGKGHKIRCSELTNYSIPILFKLIWFQTNPLSASFPPFASAFVSKNQPSLSVLSFLPSVRNLGRYFVGKWSSSTEN